MKTICSSRRHQYLAMASTFLVLLALTAGIVGCGPTQYTLTISSTEGGTVTTPGEGTFTYEAGTVVNLLVTADAGYGFGQWTTYGNTPNLADEGDATTTITMNDDYTIRADFGLEIWDWYELDAVSNNLSGIYVLMNDLDSSTLGYEELASPTANEGKGWKPIGATLSTRFSGTLYGKGYEIRNLFINRLDEEYVGLFGGIRSSALIFDIGVVNAKVTGKDNVGGLVGINQGYVFDSYSTSNVTGTGGGIGGLVGQNGGTIINSYATGSIGGNTTVGGLVGQNGGTIINSYSTSSVTGNYYIGGLVGYIFPGGSVNDSFWDTETSGQTTSDGGTGKTTAEMKDIATFSGATWDIIAVGGPGERNPSYIWNIVDDETYPFLSWEPVS
jgi:hypothetical protein